MSSDMTPDQLRELASVAHDAAQKEADDMATVLIDQADLALAYTTCAADQLAQGAYTHALQLVRRAGEVCEHFESLHSDLGGGS